VNTRVSKILSPRSGPRAWVPPVTPVGDALGVMDREAVELLAVLEGRHVRGAVSRRKLATCMQCLTSCGPSPASAPVERVMATSVLTVDSGTALRELLHRMSLVQASYAVVIEAERFLGLLPLREVCLAVALDLDDEVDQLTTYICGSPTPEPRRAQSAASKP